MAQVAEKGEGGKSVQELLTPLAQVTDEGSAIRSWDQLADRYHIVCPLCKPRPQESFTLPSGRKGVVVSTCADAHQPIV